MKSGKSPVPVKEASDLTEYAESVLSAVAGPGTAAGDEGDGIQYVRHRPGENLR